MKTSSFYLYDGPGRISIARSAPRRVAAGFRVYRALAPGPWRHEAAYKYYDAYRARYLSDILGPLDPRATWEALHALAGEHEPVLLCHEHLLKPGDWCHRRLVAEWLEATLGERVDELQTDKHRAHALQTSLF